MADATIQELIFERLDNMEKEQIQQGKDIAAIKQHLTNNAEHKKHDWQRVVVFGGWLLTILGLFLSIFVKK